MLRIARCLLLILPLLLLAPASHAAPLATKDTGAAPAEFLPAGWSLESTTTGDLNGDGIDDVVLVLLETDVNKDDRGRALLVLVKDGANWKRLAANRGLAACFKCGGASAGDAAPRLTIKKGVLTIDQSGGSRERYGTSHKFRLDKATGKFVLIGLDQSNADSVVGGSTLISDNLLNGARITTTTPPSRDEEGNEFKPAPKATVEKQKIGKKPPVLFEDVVTEQ